MENPDTWGEAERVVYEAYAKHNPNSFSLSLMRTITDALRSHELLKTGYANENIRRLLASLDRLHEWHEVESDDEYPLFMCRHCDVPYPCETMRYVHEIEKYAL